MKTVIKTLKILFVSYFMLVIAYNFCYMLALIYYNGLDFYEDVEIQTINGDVFCINESRVDVEFFHLDTGEIVNADNVVLIKKGNKIDVLKNFRPAINLFSHFNGLIQ